MADQAKPAARMRIVDGDLIGTTALFRNRPLLKRLGAEIARLGAGGGTVTVLNHACSIGAEAYSLAVWMLLHHPETRFHISATDISPSFVKFAARGEYPTNGFENVGREEVAFFRPAGVNVMAVGDAVRERVTFLPAASFVDFAGDSFDVVLLCNGLMYVPAIDQARALDRIAGYNRSLLALTGGHEGTIAADLARNGYAPVMEDFEAIHGGWADRLKPASARGTVRNPPHIFTDPYLYPIDDAPGWQYRHGALFQKQAAVQAA